MSWDPPHKLGLTLALEPVKATPLASTVMSNPIRMPGLFWSTIDPVPDGPKAVACTEVSLKLEEARSTARLGLTEADVGAAPTGTASATTSSNTSPTRPPNRARQPSFKPLLIIALPPWGI